MRKRKLEMSFGEEDCHCGGMPVHHGLLMGAIADVQDPHCVIFKLYSIVLCIYIDRVFLGCSLGFRFGHGIFLLCYNSLQGTLRALKKQLFSCSGYKYVVAVLFA